VSKLLSRHHNLQLYTMPLKQWCILNRFRTNQGHCGASRNSGASLIATYARVVPLRQCPT